MVEQRSESSSFHWGIALYKSDSLLFYYYYGQDLGTMLWKIGPSLHVSLCSGLGLCAWPRPRTLGWLSAFVVKTGTEIPEGRRGKGVYI